MKKSSLTFLLAIQNSQLPHSLSQAWVVLQARSSIQHMTFLPFYSKFSSSGKVGDVTYSSTQYTQVEITESILFYFFSAEYTVLNISGPNTQRMGLMSQSPFPIISFRSYR